MSADLPRGVTTTPVAHCANVVSRLFSDVFAELLTWRRVVENTGAGLASTEFDDLVASFAIPALTRDSSMLIGAGFVGNPDSPRPESRVFAWWLGATAANPLLAETTAPSRLDIAAGGYRDYLSDFTNLEWYRVPEATRQAHVTGPYVDYLCICDYVLTVTMPVLAGTDMIGVVGVDIYVKRLEKAILPAMLALEADAALVNDTGRVVVSTDVDLPVGAILEPATATGIERVSTVCEGTPFQLVLRVR